MNSTSLTFALGMAALVAFTTWGIDYGAKRSGHWSDRKRSIVRGFMILLTLATGVYVYKTDANLRGTTLFEVAGPWEENGGRVWTVEVEHPGVEHTLGVYPQVRGLDGPTRSITLRTRFGVEGRTPLVSEDKVHAVVAKSGKNSSVMTWEDAVYRFTPERAGPHQLLVEGVDGIPPFLHLRIADPKKRDGKRAPGY